MTAHVFARMTGQPNPDIRAGPRRLDQRRESRTGSGRRPDGSAPGFQRLMGGMSGARAPRCSAGTVRAPVWSRGAQHGGQPGVVALKSVKWHAGQAGGRSDGTIEGKDRPVLRRFANERRVRQTGGSARAARQSGPGVASSRRGVVVTQFRDNVTARTSCTMRNSSC